MGECRCRSRLISLCRLSSSVSTAVEAHWGMAVPLANVDDENGAGQRAT